MNGMIAICFQQENITVSETDMRWLMRYPVPDYADDFTQEWLDRRPNPSVADSLPARGKQRKE